MECAGLTAPCRCGLDREKAVSNRFRLLRYAQRPPHSMVRYAHKSHLRDGRSLGVRRLDGAFSLFKQTQGGVEPPHSMVRCAHKSHLRDGRSLGVRRLDGAFSLFKQTQGGVEPPHSMAGLRPAENSRRPLPLGMHGEALECAGLTAPCRCGLDREKAVSSHRTPWCATRTGHCTSEERPP